MPIRLSGLVNFEPLRNHEPLNEFDTAGPTKHDEDGDPDLDISRLESAGVTLKAELMKIHKQSSVLFNMLGENEEVESWIQEMIARASDAINTVHSHMSYEKSNHTGLGNGDGVPSDLQSDAAFAGDNESNHTY